MFTRSLLLTFIVLLLLGLRAHAGEPASRSCQLKSVGASFPIPDGWQRTAPPKVPEQKDSVTSEGVRLQRPVAGPTPGRGIVATAVVMPVTQDPQVVLQRTEHWAVRTAGDLWSTGRLLKRESATLWGRPAVKLAIQCTPDSVQGRATNVVCWIATDGRRMLILIAEAEPADWPAAWKGFLKVANDLSWPQD